MLPKWTGDVVSVMHRCDITRKMLADEAQINPGYLSFVLHNPNPSEDTRERIENALRSYCEKHDISFDAVYPKQ